MHLLFLLDHGHGAGPDNSQDFIPSLMFSGIIAVTSTAQSLRLVFSSPDTAREAAARTGWRLTDATTLEAQLNGNYIETLPPQFSRYPTAFYAQWSIAPDPSPPILN